MRKSMSFEPQSSATCQAGHLNHHSPGRLSAIDSRESPETISTSLMSKSLRQADQAIGHGARGSGL